ncbi:MAG: hypothetical protein IJZ72_06355 [Oscillospiraceae bacterium]|nr:hypothetical protein [Oscillospiraceae bacterium]
MSYGELSAADVAAVTRNNDSNGNGMFGNNDWSWIIILLLSRGFGGFGAGGFGASGCGCSSCATQADLAAGFNNSAVLSNLNDIKLGQANAINYNNQGFSGLNTEILQGFHGVDNAVCTLGYQTQQVGNAIQHQISDCCCDVKGAIKDVDNSVERTGWNISKQISDCCCSLEMANMQNRFDAQTYNCNTLQAIDKLGDRIENRLNAMENARVREQLDAERTKNAILQGQIDRAQLRYDIVNDVRPCPQPAYITCNPYAASYGFNGYNNGSCGNCSNF